MHAHPDRPFHPTTWAVLKALRGGARLSRNKHFALFQDPRARRALRVHRYLRSVVRDLERFDTSDLQVETVGEPGGASFALKIDIPQVKGHRTAYLTLEELRLLSEDAPEVAARIESALIDAVPGEPESGEAGPTDALSPDEA